MTLHDDCTGYDFAAGKVTGIRGFAVDSLGRLSGVHYRKVWRPGENVAHCTNQDDGGRCGEDYHGCGFWAFHDGSTYDSGEIQGVIEGYGKTTIGTRGFRAEKARIVALALPSKRPTRWDWVCIAVGLWCLGGGVLQLAQGHLIWTAIEAFLAGLNLGTTAWRIHKRPSFDNAKGAKIRRNYPDVKFYPTVKAMKRAHPIDPALEPSPETDPTFWDIEESAPAYATGGLITQYGSSAVDIAAIQRAFRRAGGAA